jgi:protein MpaA
MIRFVRLALNGLVAVPQFFPVTAMAAAAAMLAGCAVGDGAPGERTAAVAPISIASVVEAAKTHRPATGEVLQVVEIGRSREGRPILLHRFGSGEHPVLVLGGIHGSERNSAACARLLVSYLCSQPADAMAVPLAVVPEANPDGLERGVRFNARRVDLNRNFPSTNWEKGYASGGRPESEPETQAIVRIVRELQPRRILSIHSITGEPCNNYDGPAEPLARAMASANGYAVKGQIGYPTPGSLGNWAGQDLGVPVVTLELPASTPGAEAWQSNRTAILAFLLNDLARIVQVVS